MQSTSCDISFHMTRICLQLALSRESQHTMCKKINGPQTPPPTPSPGKKTLRLLAKWAKLKLLSYIKYPEIAERKCRMVLSLDRLPLPLLFRQIWQKSIRTWLFWPVLAKIIPFVGYFLLHQPVQNSVGYRFLA